MADMTNVKLGVCSVTFGGTDLGHTKGGVEVVYTPEYHDTTVDKYGNTVARKTLIGEKLVARVPLAESQLSNIAVAIPGSTNDSDMQTIGRGAGYDLDGSDAELVLHPTANTSGDRTEDVILYKAVVSNEISLKFMVDDEKVIEVEFEAIIDESKDDGSYLGLIGDSAS